MAQAFARDGGVACASPAELGAAEVAAFLSYLASDREVSAGTQNQAKSALLELAKVTDPNALEALLARAGGYATA